MYRTLLCAPPNKYDVVERAKSVNAHVAHFDLEDSVPLSQKPLVRELILNKLKENNSIPTAVRINAIDSKEGMEDILFFVNHDIAPDIIIVPKVESAECVNVVANVLKVSFPEIQMFCVIESVKALKSLDSIVRAEKHINGLIFGSADFSECMGRIPSSLDLTFAKTEIALAANQIGAYAVDSPCFNLEGDAELRNECLQARKIGFHAKIAIHPSQVPVINEVLSPTKEEFDFSKKILESTSNKSIDDGSAIAKVNKNMIGPPFVKLARKIVTSAEEMYER